MNKLSIKALLFWSALFSIKQAAAQTDTLRIMSYNVLYYGDKPACQGAHTTYHNYLKTVVSYTNPDVVGLIKMAAIPMYTGDHSGTAPAGFADSIVQYALNAAFANRYTYCTYTNTSAADDVAVLFYNKQKLGFAGILSSYVNVNDFNTYKLYYLSPNLATTHDTTFLYVTLNHTVSGTSNVATRTAQINGEMAQIQTHFTQLPNAVNMGDFNTHNSTEGCYQALVSPANAAFRYYDPPFYPDAVYSYPADWDSNPSSYSSCLTTSTRKLSSSPNSCGTSGGGKSWYDHMFLSGSIINNTQRLRYIPHSYRTIGNDGNRSGISVNDAPTNTSAPSAVIEALFQMSNKYPVMVDLQVDLSPTKVADIALVNPAFTISNPVTNKLCLNVAESLLGTTLSIRCCDLAGRVIVDTRLTVNSSSLQIPFDAEPGMYILQLTTASGTVEKIKVVKLK